MQLQLLRLRLRLRLIPSRSRQDGPGRRLPQVLTMRPQLLGVASLVGGSGGEVVDWKKLTPADLIVPSEPSAFSTLQVCALAIEGMVNSFTSVVDCAVSTSSEGFVPHRRSERMACLKGRLEGGWQKVSRKCLPKQKRHTLLWQRAEMVRVLHSPK